MYTLLGCIYSMAVLRGACGAHVAIMQLLDSNC